MESRPASLLNGDDKEPNSLDSTEEISKQIDTEDVIVTLLYADAIERSDTQILEIRHLQVNIIHALRLPDLYAALRYEEEFIWGNIDPYIRSEDAVSQDSDSQIEPEGYVRRTWSDAFADPIIDPAVFQRLVEIWVARLLRASDIWIDKPPEWEAQLRNWADTRTYVNYVHDPILQGLRRVRDNGDWTDDFEENYSALVALQTLNEISYWTRCICGGGATVPSLPKRVTQKSGGGRRKNFQGREKVVTKTNTRERREIRERGS